MKRGKAYVLCNGCPESGIDSANAQKYLMENGWLITENHKDADLILFNACSLTQIRTNYSLEIIQKIQEEKKSSSQLIVWGCLPKIEPEVLREKYNGSTFSESELSSLQKIVDGIKPIEEISANYVLPAHPESEPFGKRSLIRSETSLLIRCLGYPVLKWACFLESRINLYRPGDPSIYYIKVATGCLGTCAYCSVRKSRGSIKSKTIEKIMLEFKEGLKKGYKNFSLIGTDLGAYGRDIDSTLVDLLKEMIKESGDFKIGLRNVNPYWLKKMMSELIPIFESKRIWYIETAAESGSNKILKLMKRRYTIEEFKRCIQDIRRAYPDIVIRTQLMVGFPTETEQDFKETMHLLDDVVFDYVEVYRFSNRPGTTAGNIKNQVPEETIKWRFLNLNVKALINRTPRKMIRILKYPMSGF